MRVGRNCTRRDHLQRLRAAGIDVERTLQSRELEMALPQDTYLKTGRFNKDAMLVLIQEALKSGSALGFPLTRGQTIFGFDPLIPPAPVTEAGSTSFAIININ